MTAVQTHAAVAVRRWWCSRMGYRFLVELTGISLLVMGYKYVRFLARDAGGPALDNAQKVLGLQDSLGFDIEAGMQDLALQSHAFIRIINQYYVTSHFLVTVTVMFGIYLFRPRVYTRLRWVLIGITLMALAIHVAFPLAPPRMMSSTGLIDTLRAYGPEIYGSPNEGSANQFAAMPSLHFGYAALAAWGIVLSFRTRWRYLALIHPILMLYAIMATANHYWVDAAVAGLLLVAAGLVTWRLVDGDDHDAEGEATNEATDEGFDAEDADEAPPSRSADATNDEVNLIDA